MKNKKNIYAPRYEQEYESQRLENADDRKCLISFEKILDHKHYGLCLDKKHSHYKSQNAKKYNTALIKLFCFLCERTWLEIHSIPKDREYGHENFSIDNIKIQAVKSYFKELGKTTFDTFRFGSQKFRACGFRQIDTFYLVCIDYDYSLYNHGS
ncbi:hypothetical protein [Helicobacter sp. T3_23-1059]